MDIVSDTVHNLSLVCIAQVVAAVCHVSDFYKVEVKLDFDAVFNFAVYGLFRNGGISIVENGVVFGVNRVCCRDSNVLAAAAGWLNYCCQRLNLCRAHLLRWRFGPWMPAD